MFQSVCYDYLKEYVEQKIVQKQQQQLYKNMKDD